MALGIAFPPELALASAKRQLVPGVVVKFRTIMDDGESHEKRFVVLSVDDETMTCVINTSISRLIQNNRRLLDCQVTIRRDGHGFMDWDSHVDCSRIRKYSTKEICQQLVENPEWVLGPILTELRDEICSALKFSPLESPAVVGACCHALSTANLEHAENRPQ